MSDDVKELQLLPCPFCGGQPELCELGEDEPDNAGGWVVQCVGCQASSRVHFSVKEDARPHVISAWNARTAADKAAEVERLREALREATDYLEVQWDYSDPKDSEELDGIMATARAALSPPPTDSTTFPMPSPMIVTIAEPYEPSAETQATLRAIEENRRRAHALASTTFVGNDSFPTPSVPGNHLLSGSEEG